MNSEYYMSQSSGSQLSDAETAAIVGAILLFLLVLVLISYIITAWLLSRVFKKAGVKPWIAWVPIYNGWKILELGNQQGFWALLAIVPPVYFVSIIFTYIAFYHIGKKFGKEDWFILLAIFLPIVWLAWLAFDDSKWQKTSARLNTKPVAKPQP